MRIETDQESPDLAIERLKGELGALQAELAGLDKRVTADLVIVRYPAATVVFALSTLMGLNAWRHGSAAGFGIVLIFGAQLAVLCGVSLRQYRTRAAAAREAHSRIDPVLDQKQVELEQHRRAVNMRPGSGA
jgi:hypothetical protein